MMLTFEDAVKLYKNFEEERARLDRLRRYYDAEHDILNKQNRGSKEDAKIVNNYPGYIATITTGHFLGRAIEYSGIDENEELVNILKRNFEPSVNNDLALDMAIYGVAYELNYHDEEGEFCFDSIDPRNVIVLTDGKIRERVTDAIVFDEHPDKDNKIVVTMTVYDDTDQIKYAYKKDEGSDTKPEDMLTEEPKTAHNSPRCPMIQYKNNKSSKGDFEKVMTEIDGYDIAVSTSVDDLTDFTDAFLKIINMTETDSEDIEEAKKNKVFKVDGDGDVDWMIKTVNDAYAQNVKNRLNSDIHKFSHVPDMSDENFANNASGVAIKHKLLALEQIRQEKEKNFRKGLFKRFQNIADYLGKTAGSFDIYDLTMKFSANLPQDMLEMAQIARDTAGTLSQRSRIAFIPGIDATAELEQIKLEKEEAVENQMNLVPNLDDEEAEEEPENSENEEENEDEEEKKKTKVADNNEK
ncbi:phage portal protein [Listeria marthii]|uniref:phage portal protein n=1 Tax=Listeria marthii TaxID=529731 RepID=UPI001889B91F|nr:phage portal protein [Listeria marthii]MBF2536422.1 phage portal protein [Listeria marthii]